MKSIMNLENINLPKDIIKYILLFDNRFSFIKGKVRLINRLSSDDKRYDILNSIPLIVLSKDLYSKISFVYLPINESREFHLLYRENKDKIVLEKIMYSSNCSCSKVINCYVY